MLIELWIENAHKLKTYILNKSMFSFKLKSAIHLAEVLMNLLSKKSNEIEGLVQNHIRWCTIYLD